MKHTAAVSAIFLLVLSCGGGETQTAAEWVPELPVDTLEIVTEIGQELGDSTCTFAAVADVEFLPDGRVIVADQVAADLKWYDAAGNYLGHLARRGSGPGELGFPWYLCMLDNGTLMVMDPFKQGFVVFDDSLQFKEEISLWIQNPPFMAAALEDSQFVAYKIDTDNEESRISMKRSVALFNYNEADWERVFWQDSISATFSEMIANPSMFIIDLLDPMSIATNGSDRVFFSLKDGEEYSITGWDLQGTAVLDISMELEPVAKTPEEMAAESTYVTNYVARMSGGGGGFQMEFEPDPYKDMIADLSMGPDGCLWARRGTLQSPFFDIYDMETGELLRHVVFPVEGWSWRTVVSENGIAAWEEDPELGFQVLYLLEVNDEKLEGTEAQI